MSKQWNKIEKRKRRKRYYKRKKEKMRLLGQQLSAKGSTNG